MAITANFQPKIGQDATFAPIFNGQNHPEVVGTYPGHHPQPIGRNRVFEIERPDPPLSE